MPSNPQTQSSLVIHTPVDRAAHPAAIANEPAERTPANMEMKAEDVEMGDEGHVFRILALYTCAPVNAGEELTWNYGQSYEPVRRQDGYVAGECCTASGALLPPLADRAREIYRALDGTGWQRRRRPCAGGCAEQPRHTKQRLRLRRGSSAVPGAEARAAKPEAENTMCGPKSAVKSAGLT